ncbi:hypothetical protein [Volucribacter amazonae]|uniref:Uncharacterized protein n=1 Tax=Volucribacter amazonae TaxID=256731 RepID=A0A9X4SJ06_9PAST|nr:hypothetical protein [Volucribacter amazonae]MDG6896202.1 hypothetical protein [Volucribacter amazonae]
MFKDRLIKNLISLEKTIPVIDKIASSYDDKETLALALFLFFKQEKILDRLAHIRSDLYSELKNRSYEEYEEFLDFLETDYVPWKIPYNATKEELLEKIKNSK